MRYRTFQDPGTYLSKVIVVKSIANLVNILTLLGANIRNIPIKFQVFLNNSLKVVSTKDEKFALQCLGKWALALPYSVWAIFKTLRHGAIMPPLVTLLFLKVEGQNLVASGILVCFLQKWH